MSQIVNFDHVLTVISGVSYLYRVKLMAPPDDTSNPLDRNPYVYAFDETSKDNNRAEMHFVVKVTPQVAGEHIDIIPKKVHCDAIRFGLRSKQQSPELNDFQLDSAQYESMNRETKLKGQALKTEILRFIFTVNSQWPAQGVSIYDLIDNFNNTYDEITGWCLDLSEAELLTRKAQGQIYWRNRGQVNANPFTINPKNYEDVERILEKKRHNSEARLQRSEQVKVFLSYSVRNKKVANTIKTHLESEGMEVFLAHEAIKVSDRWRDRILQELKECDVFVAILTDKFRESSWCDQEGGFAMAYGKKIVSLMVGQHPHGFLESYQATKLNKKNVSNACSVIIDAISSDAKLSKAYYEAKKLYKRYLKALSTGKV